MSVQSLAVVLRQGIERLQPSSSSPRLDAEILLAAALKRPRSHLIAYAEDPLPTEVTLQFNEWLELRAAGMPVAYLTGRKEFWSLELEVTPAVLAPRPETELLVETALQWLAPSYPSKVLDLGTGSGAIALALAHERPAIQVTAIDQSPAALEVARRNAARLNLNNVIFMCGDWYAPLNTVAPPPRFDVIVSNPPYIAANDSALQTPELLAEPRMALTPGPSGLESIECIAREARRFLQPHGWLAVEHGADQGPAARALFIQFGFNAVSTAKDLAGHDRITRGTLSVVSHSLTSTP